MNEIIKKVRSSKWLTKQDEDYAIKQLNRGIPLTTVLRRLSDWEHDAKHESRCDSRASMMGE